MYQFWTLMIIVLPSIKEVSSGSSDRWPVLLFHSHPSSPCEVGKRETMKGSAFTLFWAREPRLLGWDCSSFIVSTPKVWRRDSFPSSWFLSLSRQAGKYPNACFPVRVSVVLSDGAVSWKEWSVPGAKLFSPNPHVDHFTAFCCEGPLPRGRSYRQVQVQLLVQNLDHFRKTAS